MKVKSKGLRLNWKPIKEVKKVKLVSKKVQSKKVIPSHKNVELVIS